MSEASKKQQLISETVYREMDRQLRLHLADPIVYSPTSPLARMAKHLAERYATSYSAIATLLEELDEEQSNIHLEWRGLKQINQ